jgi:hypothetical protein
VNKSKKLWVAVTAHNPLRRLSSLFTILKLYTQYELDVSVFLYVNYEAQDDVDKLSSLLRPFSEHIKVEIIVADPQYEGWWLTWAHKTDLTVACMRREYDYFIYQENDMCITWENFKYWLRWKPRLAPLGLEPGFIRYELFGNKKIPFDNFYRYSLTDLTPNVWSDRGFMVSKQLVVDHEIKFFVSLANPYYAAMLLDADDAVKYVKSDSMDPMKSVELASFRNWPLADRSSMGLAFENPPSGCEHRRFVPVIEKDGSYVPHECCLVQHDDIKYSLELNEKFGNMITCDTLLKI